MVKNNAIFALFIASMGDVNSFFDTLFTFGGLNSG